MNARSGGLLAAVTAVVVVVGVPIWLGGLTPEEPVAPPTTLPGPVTTIPDVQEDGKLTVETSLGTWQWVRGDDGLPGFGSVDEPASVELPDPPLPAIEELAWPQIDREFAGTRWDPLWGYPVSSGGVTIIPASVGGHIDWNRFYTNSDGWVEGRWRPLDGDCPWPEVCPTQTATLEILGVREEPEDGGVSYPVGGVLDVLVASIISGDPDAVEFRDEDTGELVLRVEATDEVSAQHLLRAGQACVGGYECGVGMALWKLYVEGVGWVDPPWQGMDLIGWSGVEAGVGDDGFWIVGIEGSWVSSTLHAWSSSDGVNWKMLAPPFPLGDALGDGLPQMDVAAGDTVVITPPSNPDETSAPPLVLRLVDGKFEEVEVDLTPFGLNLGTEIHDFSSTPWGWMANTWTTNSWAGFCEVWVSADGSTWEEITTPDGTDIGETVNVFSYEVNEDGSAVADNPVPAPAESVPAEVAASDCQVADDNSVYLTFEHLISGTGPADGSYPDFYYTSWLGEFVDGGGRDRRLPIAFTQWRLGPPLWIDPTSTGLGYRVRPGQIKAVLNSA